MSSLNFPWFEGKYPRGNARDSTRNLGLWNSWNDSINILLTVAAISNIIFRNPLNQKYLNFLYICVLYAPHCIANHANMYILFLKLWILMKINSFIVYWVLRMNLLRPTGKVSGTEPYQLSCHCSNSICAFASKFKCCKIFVASCKLLFSVFYSYRNVSQWCDICINFYIHMCIILHIKMVFASVIY